MAGGVNSLRANTYISSKFLNISYIPCRKNVCIDGEEKCPKHLHTQIALKNFGSVSDNITQ